MTVSATPRVIAAVRVAKLVLIVESELPEVHASPVSSKGATGLFSFTVQVSPAARMKDCEPPAERLNAPPGVKLKSPPKPNETPAPPCGTTLRTTMVPLFSAVST